MKSVFIFLILIFSTFLFAQAGGIKVDRTTNPPTWSFEGEFDIDGGITATSSYIEEVNHLTGNFMQGILAENRQVYKIACFGNSIMRSGFGTNDLKATGAYTPDGGYLHLTRYIEDYLLDTNPNFDTPVKRNIEHADWTLTGATTEYSSYPYDDFADTRNAICVIDNAGEDATLGNITGEEILVLIFEGGIAGNATYDTAIAVIEVRVDPGGGFGAWQAPTALGLNGKLSKYGYGATKIYDTAVDEFDTAFTYPAEAYSPLSGGNGTAPIRELHYNGLNAAHTYEFKITRKAAETKDVRLFGAYYFTGKTIIMTNPSDPGKHWDTLRKEIYNTMVLSEVDWVFVEAPIYHDQYSESSIRSYCLAFIQELKDWGIEVCMLSCPPGGFLSQGANVTALGDAAPTYYAANLNFVDEFNAMHGFTLTATPAYADYPDKDCVYRMAVEGTNYDVTGILKKPNSTDFTSWTYKDVFLFVVDTADEVLYQKIRKDNINFNITLTKQSGSGAATLIGASRRYFPPRFEVHRDIVLNACKEERVGFIDVYGAFKKVAESVGETVDETGYTMNESHPLWSAIDVNMRRVRLLLPNGDPVPAVTDIYSKDVDGTTRYFQVKATGGVNIGGTDYEYIEMEIIVHATVPHIYVGEVVTLSTLWSGASYDRVQGAGADPLTGFSNMYDFYPSTKPVKMNYMTNFFSGGDGHHLEYYAHSIIYGIIKNVILKNSVFID